MKLNEPQNIEQNFDELELVAEKAGELNDRVGKIENELGAQTKTLESAAMVLDAAIKGLGALKHQVLENDIGALQLALNDKTAHLAREIGRFESAVAEIDRRAEAGDEQLAASLRDIALGLRSSFDAKSAEIAEWSVRVEREIAAHSVALAAIPPVIKGADAKPFNPRGEWQAGMVANSLDVVSYNGSSYISNEDGNTDKPTRSTKYTTLAKRSGNGAGGATDFGSLTGTILPAQLVPGSATYAVGDVLYAGTTGALSKLTAGSSGQLLSTQGAGAAPIWVSATGGAGDVNGPASATDNAIVRFDGTGGKTVQNSAVTIADTTGAIAGASSLTAPATTALTLAGGSTGASLVLGQSATGRVSISRQLDSTVSDWFKLGTSTGYGFIFKLRDGTESEYARLTNTGNLLIGTTTDIAATSGGAANIAGWNRYKSANGTTVSPVEDRVAGFANNNGAVSGAGMFALNSFTDNSAAWLRFKTVNSAGTTVTAATMDDQQSLIVAGTATASTTTSGALRVGSNIGLSGNAGGASYFGGAVTAGGGLYINSFIQALGSSYMNMAGGDPYRFYNNSDSSSFTFDVGSSGGFVTSLILGARNSATGTDAITMRVRSATVAAFRSTFLDIPLSTPSTNTTSGALVVTGGVGVGGAIFAGGTVNGGIARVTSWQLDNSLAYFGHSSAAGAAGTYAMLHSAAGNTQINGASTLTLNINNSPRLSLATNAATFAGAVTISRSQPALNLANTGGGGATWNQYVAAASGNFAIDQEGVINALTFTKTTALATFGGSISTAGTVTATSSGAHTFGTTNTVTMTAGALATTGAATFGGAVSLSTAGTTVSIKSGTNAAAGTVTLVGGAATITSTAIDVNTVIVMSIKTKTGTFDHAPSVLVAAGSATIDGHNSDDSTYNWVALKVN